MNAAVESGDNVSVDCLAIHRHALNARANVVGIAYGHVVGSSAEQTGDFEAVPLMRNGGIDLKPVILRLYTEDILGYQSSTV